MTAGRGRAAGACGAGLAAGLTPPPLGVPAPSASAPPLPRASPLPGARRACSPPVWQGGRVGGRVGGAKVSRDCCRIIHGPAPPPRAMQGASGSSGSFRSAQFTNFTQPRGETCRIEKNCRSQEKFEQTSTLTDGPFEGSLPSRPGSCVLRTPRPNIPHKAERDRGARGAPAPGRSRSGQPNSRCTKTTPISPCFRPRSFTRPGPRCPTATRGPARGPSPAASSSRRRGTGPAPSPAGPEEA